MVLKSDLYRRLMPLEQKLLSLHCYRQFLSWLLVEKGGLDVVYRIYLPVVYRYYPVARAQPRLRSGAVGEYLFYLPPAFGLFSFFLLFYLYEDA